MSPLTWLIIIVAVAAVVTATFVIVRTRQRSGDVLASRGVSKKGGRS